MLLICTCIAVELQGNFFNDLNYQCIKLPMHLAPPISHLVEQFYTPVFHHSNPESIKNAHQYTITSHNNNELQKFKVYYCRVTLTQCLCKVLMVQLWPINLSQKRDCSVSQDVLHICDGSWCHSLRNKVVTRTVADTGNGFS